MPYSDEPNMSASQAGTPGAAGSTTTPYGNTQVGPPSRFSQSSQQPPAHYRDTRQRRSQAPPPIQPVDTAPTDDDNSTSTPVIDPYDEEQLHGPPPRREYKYSTANMRHGSNNCRKFLWIVLMFALFLAFSIGIAILIDKLFFSDDEITGPQAYDRQNLTFPRDKQAVDSACSGFTYDQDGGRQCKELCLPNYTTCCDAFKDVYDMNSSSFNSSTQKPDNMTAEEQACTFGTETQGCVSYAKCVAMTTDPAPIPLENYCSEPRLSQDRQSCVDICSKNKCCFADSKKSSCVAMKLGVCMDYVPCQNLRSGPILLTAPSNLDQHCFFGTPDCNKICENAACCAVDAPESCLKDNFLSCMTYAACALSNTTTLNMTIPPIFSVVPKVPNEVKFACASRPDTAVATPKTCDEYCQAAACCNDQDASRNCFKNDPLGCLAWDRECQTLRLGIRT